jgi:hypothetical protein
VFAKYLDQTWLKSASKGCIALLVGNCADSSTCKNSALSLDYVPYSWFIGEFGDRLFTSLHANGFLSKFPVAMLSDLFSKERFCEFLKA